MASVREFINTLEAALAEAGIDDDTELALALHQQHPIGLHATHLSFVEGQDLFPSYTDLPERSMAVIALYADGYLPQAAINALDEGLDL